jgi:NAD(P)-dependent dehydrogenase (short-subunit alcohol dehydrogenase family)
LWLSGSGLSNSISRIVALPWCCPKRKDAREGAQIVIADVVDGDEVVDAIDAAGGEATFVRCDVSDEGSVEALDETRTIIRLKGGKTEVKDFPKIDSIRAEIDAFADAVAGVAPYPITTGEMVNTIASFEAIINSIKTDSAIKL